MIAMSDFGRIGRLGNQMFQYAFMRTQAERLSVPFYVPEWEGDRAFELGDRHLRCPAPAGGLARFEEPDDPQRRLQMRVADNTDVAGYFQSEIHFDRELIRASYRFRPEVGRDADEASRDLDNEHDVAVGIRLGDFAAEPSFYVPRPAYYGRALGLLGARRAFVFSDDIEGARRLLMRSGFGGEVVMVDRPALQSLAIMSRFRQFAIGPSTFHWWGAWLSRVPGKRVIAPSEGPFRPGSPHRALQFWPADWETLPGLARWDRYWLRRIAGAVR
jgi:hypothetical protein